mgnify:CR=1 FL=1
MAIVIFTQAANDGQHDAMLRQAMEIFTGYIQIHQAGYQDDPAIEKSFKFTPEIEKILKNNKKIKGYTPRLQVGALAASENNSTGALVVGIEPDLEKSVTKIYKHMASGEYLSKNDKMQCVIGEKMAKILKLKVGDNMVLLTQGIDGSTGAIKFKVKGLFRAGADELNRSLVFITLKDMRDLVLAPDMVDSIAIMTESPRDVPAVYKFLQSRFAGMTTNGKKFEILDWKQLIPEMVDFVAIDNIGAYIFLTLLMIVVIFGVLSAVFSSVLERFPEFGIMMALGTRPNQIILLVMLEGFLLTGIGIVVGLAVGIGISLYFIYHPIILPATYESIMQYYGMENKIYFCLYPLNVAIAAISVIILSLAFTFYPAWKASSLKPDKAIRSINV